MISRIRIHDEHGHDIVRDIDYGGGPFGDEDVRVVQFSKSNSEPIGASPVGLVDTRNSDQLAAKLEWQRKRRAERRGTA